MKHYSKYFVSLLIVVVSQLYAEAQKAIWIQPIEIDSITVKLIDPTAMGIGDICYDRVHFDEVFDYYELNRNLGIDSYCIHLVSLKEISLFLSILNSSIPLNSSMINVYPDQIRTLPGIDWRKPLHNSPDITNDPIETRGKIMLYMHSGETVTAFFSMTALDIFNYRYSNSTLGLWMLLYGMNADMFSEINDEY